VTACLQETGELKLEFLEQQAWVKTKRALLGRDNDIFWSNSLGQKAE